MAIKLTSVKCPECGGLFSIEEGRNKVFCTYCGAQVIVTNENEHTYRYVDEAEVEQAETERIIRLREIELAEKERLANEKRKSIKLKISIILGIIMIISIAIGYASSSGESFIMVGMVCGIVLMYMWIDPNS